MRQCVFGLDQAVSNSFGGVVVREMDERYVAVVVSLPMAGQGTVLNPGVLSRDLVDMQGLENEEDLRASWSCLVHTLRARRSLCPRLMPV